MAAAGPPKIPSAKQHHAQIQTGARQINNGKREEEEAASCIFDTELRLCPGCHFRRWVAQSLSGR